MALIINVFFQLFSIIIISFLPLRAYASDKDINQEPNSTRLASLNQDLIKIVNFELINLFKGGNLQDKAFASKNLLEMGQIPTLLDLLNSKEAQTIDLGMAMVEALWLYPFRHEQVCDIVENIKDKNNKDHHYWTKAKSFCYYMSGKWENANFLFSLIEERPAKQDNVFLHTMSILLNKGRGEVSAKHKFPINDFDSVSGLDIAMWHKGKMNFPPDLVLSTNKSANKLRFFLVSQGLGGLEEAWWGYQGGLISRDDLRRVYKNYKSVSGKLDDSKFAQLANFYKKLNVQDATTLDKASEFKKILNWSRLNGVHAIAAQLLGLETFEFTSAVPRDALGDYAFELALGYLSRNNKKEYLRWLKLIKQKRQLDFATNLGAVLYDNFPSNYNKDKLQLVTYYPPIYRTLSMLGLDVSGALVQEKEFVGSIEQKLLWDAKRTGNTLHKLEFINSCERLTNSVCLSLLYDIIKSKPYYASTIRLALTRELLSVLY